MDDVKPAHRLAATRRFLLADDVDLIQSVVPRDGAPLVVDLGSGSGTTALAVLDVNPQARIFSADISVANRDWSEKNVEAHYPDAQVDWFVGTALELARLWEEAERDAPAMLLHDAGHSYDDVYGDISAWASLLRSGTSVWVHDFAPPPPDWGAKDESEGVYRALLTLVGQGLIKQTETRGLGWLGVRL